MLHYENTQKRLHYKKGKNLFEIERLNLRGAGLGDAEAGTLALLLLSSNVSLTQA